MAGTFRQAIVQRKARQAAEMAAAVQTLGADSRSRIEENVKLRLLAQRLGASEAELENTRRVAPSGLAASPAHLATAWLPPSPSASPSPSPSPELPPRASGASSPERPPSPIPRQFLASPETQLPAAPPARAASAAAAASASPSASPPGRGRSPKVSGGAGPVAPGAALGGAAASRIAAAMRPTGMRLASPSGICSDGDRRDGAAAAPPATRAAGAARPQPVPRGLSSAAAAQLEGALEMRGTLAEIRSLRARLAEGSPAPSLAPSPALRSVAGSSAGGPSPALGSTGCGYGCGYGCGHGCGYTAGPSPALGSARAAELLEGPSREPLTRSWDVAASGAGGRPAGERRALELASSQAALQEKLRRVRSTFADIRKQTAGYASP